MVFFETEFEAKVTVVNLLDKVTFGQAEALNMALQKWDAYDKQQAEIQKLKDELKITREYIHNNGLEWDLLSYAQRNGW